MASMTSSRNMSLMSSFITFSLVRATQYVSVRWISDWLGSCHASVIMYVSTFEVPTSELLSKRFSNCGFYIPKDDMPE